MKLNNLFIIILFCIFSYAQSTFDWNDGGVEMRQGDHIEWYRTGDIGEDGEMIFAWSDTRNGIRDIFIQKINVNGEAMWGENGTIVISAPGRQEDPILVSDNSGGAFILWVDYQFESEDGDIYAQHILSDGSKAWDERGLPLSNKAGKQDSPNLCIDGQGGAYAIWKDKSESNHGHVYASHLSFGGITQEGTGVPIITNEVSHNGISLEVGGEGEAVLVWYQGAIGEEDIYGQRIGVSGNDISTLWSSPQEGGIVISEAVGAQTSAKVTYMSEGLSIAVWMDSRNEPENGDIYMQIIDSEGSFPYLDSGGVAVCSANETQQSPRVKADEYGAFIVWEDLRTPGSFGPQVDFYAQKVDLEGSIIWEANGIPISTADGTQNGIRLSTDKNGGAYCVWMDDRTGPGEAEEIDIFIQHLGNDGQITFETNGMNICSSEGMQFSALVRDDGLGGAFIIWGDERTGNISMRAQHLTINGNLSYEDNGKEYFYSIEGDALNPGAIPLYNGKGLFYWEDHRGGTQTSLTYGSKLSWDLSGAESLLCDFTSQEKPNAKVIGDNIVLGFNRVDIEDVYYQVLDYDLDFFNNENEQNIGIPMIPQSPFQLIVDEDDFAYFVFSEDSDFGGSYNIYVQKLDFEGTPQWQNPVLAVEMENAEIVRSAVPLLGGGVIFTFESLGLNRVLAYAINSQGVRAEGWPDDPIILGDVMGDNVEQYVESSIATIHGLFTVWKDTRNGSADLYGQLLSYEGDILGPPSGILITDAIADQQEVTMTYNLDESAQKDEVFICWEDFQNGFDNDIHCNTLNLYGEQSSQLSLGSEFVLAGGSGEQQKPYALTSFDNSYMITWQNKQDPQFGDYDIYFQEIINLDDEITADDYLFQENGIPVCEFEFNQVSPKISLYNENSESYIIYWEDARSTGKQDLWNIYGQSYTRGELSKSISKLIPSKLSISKIYPNPLNPSATISYYLSEATQIELNLYNVKGQLISEINKGYKFSGKHSAKFSGNHLESGIYFLALKSNDVQDVKKIIVLK